MCEDGIKVIKRGEVGVLCCVRRVRVCVVLCCEGSKG